MYKNILGGILMNNRNNKIRKALAWILILGLGFSALNVIIANAQIQQKRKFDGG